MKKTILTSTLAVSLGITGFAADNSADASEQNVDQAKLVNLVQNNPEQLNESPIQKGSYNYDFIQNGVSYHFESDGVNFSWSYNGYNNTTAEINNDGQQEVSKSEQPVQQQAPQTKETQQPQQQATTNISTQSSQNSNEASSGSSVEVNDHLKLIAQRESGGDITAINPSSGAAGKYQFLQTTWDSVAPAEYVGVSPASAPEHVQDAAAQKLYNEVGPSQWVTAYM
ncbi:transglycosylase family protein [Staphylococcus cohnii]|nr:MULTISPECIES: transglycosylase family protein [Staphylococcus]EAW0531086.1 transglycosylase [Listeria monocytogenes]TGP59714.1 transglycosylase [bacterium M00.F.Ca.ET.229.01.1.1]TGS36549.1 transglycosylase [bacterium M00.F.Ca.ET.180.01.1.1]AQM41252.1 transglycosylase [Staphylococcus cohnii]AQM42138.1 transglycosylase [Staphylococcus cohnii]